MFVLYISEVVKLFGIIIIAYLLMQTGSTLLFWAIHKRISLYILCKGGDFMKKKLVKPLFRNVCFINKVLAFDEGFTDDGMTGFNF